VLVVFLVTGFVSATWAARLPATQERLELSAGRLAFVVLAIEGGALVGLPLGGHLADRYGSRRTLAVGMVGFPVSLGLLAIAPSLVWLCATAIVWAVINSILDVAMNSAGVELEVRRGRSCMARLHAGHSAGLLVGGLGAVAAATIGGPLWGHFIVTAFLALVAGCAATARLPAFENGRRPPRREIGRDRRLMLLGAVAFCGFLVEGGAGNWAAVDVRNHHGAPAAVAALAYTFFVVTLTVTRYVGDGLVSRFGRVKAVRAGGLLAGLGTVVVIAAPNTTSAIGGWGTVGAGVALLAPTVLAAAGQPEARPVSSSARQSHSGGSSSIAAVSTMGYFGSFSGPALIGVIADRVGLTVAIGVLSLAALAAIVLAGPALTSGTRRH
jgi:MFS family permease